MSLSLPKTSHRGHGSSSSKRSIPKWALAVSIPCLLMTSVASFSTTRPATYSSRSLHHQAASSPSSSSQSQQSTTSAKRKMPINVNWMFSSSSKGVSPLQVATSPDVSTTAGGLMPEQGKDGVYHIMNEEQHKALLEAEKDKLVVMKVYAPWCRACKGLEPKFNAIVKDKKYENLPIVWADLTIQHNKDYIKSIGVLALPTIQFYSHGLKQDTFPCGPSKVPILKRKLAQFVNDKVDPKTLKVKPMSSEDAAAAATTADASSSAAPATQQPLVSNATTLPAPEAVDDEPVDQVVQRYRDQLRAIPYFSGMHEMEFDQVLSKARLLTFDTGNIIMREGNDGRTFYYIVAGEVEICQKTSFEDPLTTPPSYLGTVINRFEKGEFFGERALITGEPRAASIRSSAMTKCLAFDRDDFPATCVLSGKAGRERETEEINILNDRYGVALDEISGKMNDRQYLETITMNQVRGSVNTPEEIDGVDNEKILPDDDFVSLNAAEAAVEAGAMAAGATPRLGVKPDEIVPLLIRFKLIRLVARCFDYIAENRPRFGDVGAQRRRNHLVNLLSVSQKVEFRDAYSLIDENDDGKITLMELRRVMDSVGSAKTEEELATLMETISMDGTQVITYMDFMGLMAETEFFHLFLETFRALDERDSGYVRAKDLDRVLCGLRDLITDDRRSIIDVEDTDMMVDYEQFSKMLLGTALK